MTIMDSVIVSRKVRTVSSTLIILYIKKYLIHVTQLVFILREATSQRCKPTKVYKFAGVHVQRNLVLPPWWRQEEVTVGSCIATESYHIETIGYLVLESRLFFSFSVVEIGLSERRAFRIRFSREPRTQVSRTFDWPLVRSWPTKNTDLQSSRVFN